MAQWVVFNNKICRAYTSGTVRNLVSIVRFKFETTTTGFALSYQYMPRSCLVDKSWRVNAFSWSNSYTFSEAKREAQKEMLKIVNKTFYYWN